MENEWLPSLKTSLRIDYDAEDSRLLSLLKTAKEFATLYIEPIEEGEAWPEPVVQAIILLAGHWYENPTATTTLAMHDNSFGFWTLLTPYMPV